MRITRMAALLAAMFTALMLALSTGSVAEAATKPAHRVIALDAGETSRDGVFYVKGTAVTAIGKRVYLQARTKSRPTFRTVKSELSSSRNGRFRIRFNGKCGAGYQIVIRETSANRRTAIRIGKVTCR